MQSQSLMQMTVLQNGYRHGKVNRNEYETRS